MPLLRRLSLRAMSFLCSRVSGYTFSGTLSSLRTIWFLGLHVSGCPPLGQLLPSELYGSWASQSLDALLSEWKHFQSYYLFPLVTRTWVIYNNPLHSLPAVHLTSSCYTLAHFHPQANIILASCLRFLYPIFPSFCNFLYSAHYSCILPILT